MRQIDYDPKCEELARHFLSHKSPESAAVALARHIQQSVEDWLEYRSAEIRDRIQSSARDQS